MYKSGVFTFLFLMFFCLGCQNVTIQYLSPFGDNKNSRRKVASFKALEKELEKTSSIENSENKK